MALGAPSINSNVVPQGIATNSDDADYVYGSDNTKAQRDLAKAQQKASEPVDVKPKSADGNVIDSVSPKKAKFDEPKPAPATQAGAMTIAATEPPAHLVDGEDYRVSAYSARPSQGGNPNSARPSKKRQTA